MFAAMVLGADGVQMGTRFVCSNEASNHPSYKQLIANSKEGDTMLSMKKIVPVRLFKNKFFETIAEAEARGATKEELAKILGHGRAKKGMLEGDLNEGELEIGEVSALIKNIKPAAEIVKEVWYDFNKAIENPFHTNQ
jgi:enoyl-[acyl-carrier protein] reductase II